MPPTAILIDCGGGSYLLGNRPGVDWDAFYELLEMEGWDMQDLGGSVDSKIRRLVRAAIRDGELD